MTIFYSTDDFVEMIFPREEHPTVPTVIKNPTVTKAEQTRKESLSLINSARSAIGLNTIDSLNCGVPGIAHACPLSRSLPGFWFGVTSVSSENYEEAVKVATVWGTTIVRVNSDEFVEFKISLPRPLSQFISFFDLERCYPDLELPEDECLIATISLPPGSTTTKMPIPLPVPPKAKLVSAPVPVKELINA